MWWIVAVVLVLSFLARRLWSTRIPAQLAATQAALDRRDWSAFQLNADIAWSLTEGQKESAGRSHSQGLIHLLYAQAAYRQGHFAETESRLTQATESFERAQAPDLHWQMSVIHRLQGDLRVDRGQSDGAVEAYRLAIAADQAMQNDALMIFNLQRLGDVLLDRGDFDDAKPVIERAVEVERQVIIAGMQRDNQDPGQVAVISMSMPDLTLANRNWEQAEKLFQEKVDFWSKRVSGPDNVDVTRYQFHLATAQREQGRLDAAITTLRQTCDTVRREFGSEHPRMARALEKLATALVTAGQPEEGEEMVKQAAALRARLEV